MQRILKYRKVFTFFINFKYYIFERKIVQLSNVDSLLVQTSYIPWKIEFRKSYFPAQQLCRASYT